MSRNRRFSPLLAAFPFALACTHPADTSSADDSGAVVSSVPYVGEHAELAVSSPSGRLWKRGIIHLHSPYSHDACDGDGMPDNWEIANNLNPLTQDGSADADSDGLTAVSPTARSPSTSVATLSTKALSSPPL